MRTTTTDQTPARDAGQKIASLKTDRQIAADCGLNDPQHNLMVQALKEEGLQAPMGPFEAETASDVIGGLYRRVEFLDQAAQRETTHVIVAVSDQGYWGKGKSLEEALTNIKKEGGSGTHTIVAYLYAGPAEELEKVHVGGMGEISYPQTVSSHRVGNIRVGVKQEVRK